MVMRQNMSLTRTAPGGATEISVADDGKLTLPLPYGYLSLDVRRRTQNHLPPLNIHGTGDNTEIDRERAGPHRIDRSRLD